MKIKLIIVAAISAVLFLNACDSVSHPEPTPTAETGAAHGAPTRPSTTNNQ